MTLKRHSSVVIKSIKKSYRSITPVDLGLQESGQPFRWGVALVTLFVTRKASSSSTIIISFTPNRDGTCFQCPYYALDHTYLIHCWMICTERRKNLPSLKVQRYFERIHLSAFFKLLRYLTFIYFSEVLRAKLSSFTRLLPSM